MFVYVDSCVLIYFLESKTSLQVRASTKLASLASRGDSVVFSDLTRLECRLKPMQMADQLTLTMYDRFFASPMLQFAPMTTRVFDLATTIRAKHAIKLGDALHLAAAMNSGCQQFLTHDARLSSFTGIQIEVL
jgi:predicted nucleic acid-binding protein